MPRAAPGIIGCFTIFRRRCGCWPKATGRSLLAGQTLAQRHDEILVMLRSALHGDFLSRRLTHPLAFAEGSKILVAHLLRPAVHRVPLRLRKFGLGIYHQFAALRTA